MKLTDILDFLSYWGGVLFMVCIIGGLILVVSAMVSQSESNRQRRISDAFYEEYGVKKKDDI